MRFIVRLFVEGLIFAALYTVIGRAIRRLGFKLGENAVLGWIDDRIAEAFGITAPTLSALVDFVWDWGLPLFAVVAILWGYHQFNKRWSSPELSMLKVLAAFVPPLRRARAYLEPHLIAIGLAVIVLGVLIAGYGALKRPAIVAGGDTLHATAILGPVPDAASTANDQIIRGLKTQRDAADALVHDLKSQLTTKEAELAAAHKSSSPPPAPPRGPFDPPPAKNPYLDGPIFERKFTSTEAETMLSALREFTDIASDFSLLQAVPTELFRRMQFGSSRPDNPQNWIHAIKLIGFDAAIEKLQNLEKRAKDYGARIIAVHKKYPVSYSGDLHRMVGNPATSELENSAAGYIHGLSLLKRATAQPEDLNNLVSRSLASDAARLEQTYVDFRAWHGSFINQRGPAARKELEARLK